MLFGFAAFAERPFSTVADDGDVTITLTANTLSISIGNPGITADAIIEDPTGSQVTLGIGTVTITGRCQCYSSQKRISIRHRNRY